MSNIIKTYQEMHKLPITGRLDKPTLIFIKKECGIKNNIQFAHLLGQMYVESAVFTARRENLNYSPKLLMRTFSYYYRYKTLAYNHGRTALSKANQEAIANAVYDDDNRSNSLKLGNTKVGDGWKYRGGFGIQTTGYFNYAALSKSLNAPEILEDPDSVIEKYYFLAGKAFFDQKNIWSKCKDLSVETSEKITSIINGPKKLHKKERYDRTIIYYNRLQNFGI